MVTKANHGENKKQCTENPKALGEASGHTHIKSYMEWTHMHKIIHGVDIHT